MIIKIKIEHPIEQKFLFPAVSSPHQYLNLVDAYHKGGKKLCCVSFELRSLQQGAIGVLVSQACHLFFESSHYRVFIGELYFILRNHATFICTSDFRPFISDGAWRIANGADDLQRFRGGDIEGDAAGKFKKKFSGRTFIFLCSALLHNFGCPYFATC